MATSRRKTAGFTAPGTEEETVSVEELLDENGAEMFETISQTEPVTETTPVEVAPFVEREIIPTEDAGPRFVEELLPPSHTPNAVAPKLQNPPKRHPRNIPKFSRFK
jgi:hypothetical protein